LTSKGKRGIMNPVPSKKMKARPSALTFLVIVNGLGAILTVLFWAVVYMKKLVPRPVDVVVLSERANAAVTFGFMIGDLILSVPLLILSTLGLYRLQFWGWTAAQMVNVLWIYSLTVIWIRDGFTTISPGGLVFLPFALISLWATGYLWKRRRLFGDR
jgi:hypothetical protein